MSLKKQTQRLHNNLVCAIFQGLSCWNLITGSRGQTEMKTWLAVRESLEGGKKKKKRNVPKEHSYYLPWLSSTLCASAMRPLPLLRGPYLSLVIKQAQRFLTQTNHGSTSMKWPVMQHCCCWPSTSPVGDPTGCGAVHHRGFIWTSTVQPHPLVASTVRKDNCLRRRSISPALWSVDPYDCYCSMHRNTTVTLAAVEL